MLKTAEKILLIYTQIDKSMKKLTLLVLICTALLSTAKAQTKEKGFFAEASAAYSNTEFDDHYAIITPAIGYQFSSKWSAGMKMGFEMRTYGYTIYSPFIRFNFLQAGELKLFTEAQANILSRDVEGGQSGYGEAGVSFGAIYPISNRLKLVGHYLFVGVSGEEGREGASVNKGDFTLDANVRRLQFGLQFIF